MRARRAAARTPTSSPSTRTVPRDGRRRPQITSMSVVLPAPLGPTTPTTVPGRTRSERPSSARTRPKLHVTSTTSIAAADSNPTESGLDVRPSVTRLCQAQARERDSAAMVLGYHPVGDDRELLEHAVGRAERAQDELGPASLHVFLDLGDQDLGGPEGGGLPQGRFVDPTPLEIRRRDGQGAVTALGEGVVDQGAEVVLGHLAARRLRQLLHALHAGVELAGRDQGRDPAVAETRGPPDGGLALAADPDGRRGLPGLGEDTDAIQLVELALEAHLVAGPEQPDDMDRLIRPPAPLLERDARGLELAWQLDADADGGEEAAAGEPVDRRHLLGGHDRRAIRQDDHARAELELAGAGGDGGQGGHDLGDGRRRGEAIGEPEGVDAALLEELAERPEERSPVAAGRPGPRHDADAILDLHGRRSYAYPGARSSRRIARIARVLVPVDTHR